MIGYFERIPSRRERTVWFFARWFHWGYVRQTPPLYRLTMWWLNRDRQGG